MCFIFIPNFRDRVTKNTLNGSTQVTDVEILDFYNLATSKILTGLEVSCNIKTNNIFIHQQYITYPYKVIKFLQI